MRLERYEAVSVTVGEIVIISKYYPSGLRNFLKQQCEFSDVDKYNRI